MKTTDNSINVFFALVRAGLWEKDARIISYGEFDYDGLMRLADEQSVIGLVTAGLERVSDVKIPKEMLLQFIGSTLQIEQQNKEMNAFVAELIEKMRRAGIYTLLVKGQGIAQCYEKPLWRSCGDVDLFLSEDNYAKAKDYLSPLASSVDEEYVREKCITFNFDEWVVELHGVLTCGLSNRIESQLVEIYQASFYGGNVRSWNNGRVQVFMLGIENDVFYVFTHILQHFYKGGIGIRQLCDWCRLLWTHRGKIDMKKLESRIRKARLKSEWKAFGVFAVEYLGMPIEAMPLLDENDNENEKLKKKAERVKDFILMSGNFGHNRDKSYYAKFSYVVRKFFSMKMRVGDLFCHARIFPLDSLRFSFAILKNGVVSALRGEG